MDLQLVKIRPKSADLTVMAAASSPRRALARALVGGACLAGALASAALPSSGATSTSVVSVTVPSATWIDTAGCAPDVANKTSFGTVLPGSSVVTSVDCDVEFGSSNDTASLRTWQTDGNGTAMARPTSSWTARVSGTASDLHDVQPVPGGAAWVSGNSGRMLKTTDGGATWTLYSSAQTGTVQWLFGVTATSASNAWGVGGSGTIVRTTDGGTSWTAQSLGGASLNDIDTIDGTTLFAVGSGGRIVRSTDAGVTWSTLTSPVVEDLWELDVVDASVIWAVGFNGSLIRSVDGGATWSVRPSPAAGQNNRAVAALDANRVWVGDSLADLSYSSNAGGSWTLQLDRDGGVTNVYSIDVVDGGTVFSAAGNAGFIDRSWDGGATFTDETPGGAPGIYAVGAIDSLTAYAVGVGGAIYTSNAVAIPDFLDDGSADWDTAGSLNLFGACLRDADLGAAGGGGGWVEDTNAGADCADGDADPWNAIPAASPGAKIASIAAPDAEGGATDPVAHLRFGFRAKDDQSPGRYLAPITFQVVAPAT